MHALLATPRTAPRRAKSPIPQSLAPTCACSLLRPEGELAEAVRELIESEPPIGIKAMIEFLPSNRPDLRSVLSTPRRCGRARRKSMPRQGLRRGCASTATGRQGMGELDAWRQ